MARLEDIETGHLVEKTIGTTNEISFSVLDKKKGDSASKKTAQRWEISAEKTEKKPQKEKVAKPEKVKERKFDSVAKRRARRKGAKILICAAVACALIGGAAAGAFFINSKMQEQNANAATLKEAIQNAVTIADKNDKLRSDLQVVLTSDAQGIANSGVLDTLETEVTDAQERSKTITSTKSNISKLMDTSLSSVEHEAGNDAILLLNSESEFAKIGANVAEYVPSYLSAREVAVEAMDLIVQADSLDREASSLLTNANIDDAKTAITKANESREYALSAKVKFQELSALDSQFENYIEFCDLRAQAQVANAAAAQAYVDRDKDELVEQNDLYNSLQSQASEIYAKFSTQPAQTLDDEFEAKRAADASNFKDEQTNRESLRRLLADYLNRK